VKFYRTVKITSDLFDSMVADIIPIFGSINMIGGELDG